MGDQQKKGKLSFGRCSHISVAKLLHSFGEYSHELSHVTKENCVCVAVRVRERERERDVIRMPSLIQCRAPVYTMMFPAYEKLCEIHVLCH